MESLGTRERSGLALRGSSARTSLERQASLGYVTARPLDWPDAFGGDQTVLSQYADLSIRHGLLGTLVAPYASRVAFFRGSEGTGVSTLPLRGDAQFAVGKNQPANPAEDLVAGSEFVGSLRFEEDLADDLPRGAKAFQGALLPNTGFANSTSQLGGETCQFVPVVWVDADIPASKPAIQPSPPEDDDDDDDDDDDEEEEEEEGGGGGCSPAWPSGLYWNPASDQWVDRDGGAYDLPPPSNPSNAPTVFRDPITGATTFFGPSGPGGVNDRGFPNPEFARGSEDAAPVGPGSLHPPPPDAFDLFVEAKGFGPPEAPPVLRQGDASGNVPVDGEVPEQREEGEKKDICTTANPPPPKKRGCQGRDMEPEAAVGCVNDSRNDTGRSEKDGSAVPGTLAPVTLVGGVAVAGTGTNLGFGADNLEFGPTGVGFGGSPVGHPPVMRDTMGDILVSMDSKDPRRQLRIQALPAWKDHGGLRRPGSFNLANWEAPVFGDAGGPATAEGAIQLNGLRLNTLGRIIKGAFGGPQHLEANLALRNRNRNRSPAPHHLDTHYTALPGSTLDIGARQAPTLKTTGILHAPEGATIRALGGGIHEITREHRGPGIVRDLRPALLIRNRVGIWPREAEGDLIAESSGKFRVKAGAQIQGTQLQSYKIAGGGDTDDFVAVAHTNSAGKVTETHFSVDSDGNVNLHNTSSGVESKTSLVGSSTEDRTQTLQDKDGTVALLSDITGSGDLQDAYDASGSAPHVTVDATNGAVALQDHASTPQDILTVRNGSGTAVHTFRTSKATLGGDLEHTGSNVGFYGTTPVGQAVDPGLLTDSTGGSPDGTLSAVSGTGDDSTINDNFAELNTQLNLIIAMLGASVGVGIHAG